MTLHFPDYLVVSVARKFGGQIQNGSGQEGQQQGEGEEGQEAGGGEEDERARGHGQEGKRSARPPRGAPLLQEVGPGYRWIGFLAENVTKSC